MNKISHDNPNCNCEFCDSNKDRKEVFKQVAQIAQKYGVAQSGYGSYQYTLGMWKYDLPDLIVTIDHSDISRQLMNEIYTYLVVNKNELTLGDDKVFMSGRGRSDLSCYFLELKSEQFLDQSIAGEFYELHPEFKGTGKHRIVQFIYPDKNNIFPFVDGYDGIKQRVIDWADDTAIEKLIKFKKTKMN